MTFYQVQKLADVLLADPLSVDSRSVIVIHSYYLDPNWPDVVKQPFYGRMWT